MTADGHGLAGRPPFPAALGVLAHVLLFLASTLITGCPAARCSLACAAIYRN